MTVYRLPPYAPEFNPVEGVWSHLKRSLANLTKHSLDQVTKLVETRLKRMRYRPCLIDGLAARPDSTSNALCSPAATDVTMTHLAQHVSTNHPCRKLTLTKMTLSASLKSQILSVSLALWTWLMFQKRHRMIWSWPRRCGGACPAWLPDCAPSSRETAGP
ncbi:transposase [Streptomyces sp. NPDC048516]|uniref:transposase n=1 Tax=Streptomyces sp. NPDC048516 TaxID=3365565 RepID=UPI003710B90F